MPSGFVFECCLETLLANIVSGFIFTSCIISKNIQRKKIILGNTKGDFLMNGYILQELKLVFVF